MKAYLLQELTEGVKLENSGSVPVYGMTGIHGKLVRYTEQNSKCDSEYRARV